MNKKITIILFLIFVILTLLVKFYPIVTSFDLIIIKNLQDLLSGLPCYIPELPDCKLYSVMVALPLVCGSVWFSKEKLYNQILLLCSIPLVTFLLNCCVKPLIHRPRPPFELQLSVHPHSFSYVSSHSLVTFCLYAMVIYYFCKSCKNQLLRNFVVIFSCLWILFVGFSRIWLGVHHLTDVLSAYLLGAILVNLYVKLGEKL